MAVRDQVTTMDMVQSSYDAIASDTTTVGAIIDTADYELGFSVFISAPVWADGTYTLKLEESDDSAMSGAVDIDSSKLIGSLPAVAAATVDGAALGKVGVFSNLRYVRISIVSTDFAASGILRHPAQRLQHTLSSTQRTYQHN
jgi:hypothetical protein